MIELSEHCQKCGSTDLVEVCSESKVISSFVYYLPDETEIVSLTECCNDCGYICTKNEYEPDPDCIPGGHDYN